MWNRAPKDPGLSVRPLPGHMAECIPGLVTNATMPCFSLKSCDRVRGSGLVHPHTSEAELLEKLHYYSLL